MRRILARWNSAFIVTATTIWTRPSHSRSRTHAPAPPSNTDGKIGDPKIGKAHNMASESNLAKFVAQTLDNTEASGAP